MLFGAAEPESIDEGAIIPAWRGCGDIRRKQLGVFNGVLASEEHEGVEGTREALPSRGSWNVEEIGVETLDEEWMEPWMESWMEPWMEP